MQTVLKQSPMRLFVSIASAALLTSAAGCATQETRVIVNTYLPMVADGLYVVYEPTDHMSRTPVRPGKPNVKYKDGSSGQLDGIDMLGEGVNGALTAQLNAAHIETQVLPFDDALMIAKADRSGRGRRAGWRNLHVKIIKDLQTCTQLACAHRFTIRVAISDVRNTKVDWSVDIQEPHVTPPFESQARFDDLAKEVGKSVLKVVKATG